ncbi:hypothetical protein PMAYCL1PPCAC_08966 [Pristionchus mayeri]|uniref:Uncharacterized protein n=1 Tax=Pristionchus mayeri TaxID=1317129 RepID=A0AAN4ZGR1_9BILA|nr:hypothetical protein PMAYCL1PPCAC_08966 [Pristionchus mayeri]
MAIPQKFLDRNFRLLMSRNHDDFFAAHGFSRCRCFYRSIFSTIRGGMFLLEPINYGITYVLTARIHGKDREMKFLPGQQIRGIGFNGKPVEISFTMEGDYLKEVHVPLDQKQTKNRPDCVYYDVVEDVLVAKAFHYKTDSSLQPVVWERTYKTKNPIQAKHPFRDHLDERL